MILFIPRNMSLLGMRSGGVRREAQVWEVMAGSGLPVRRVNEMVLPQLGRFRRLLAVRHRWQRRPVANSWRPTDLLVATHREYWYDGYLRTLRAYPEAKVVALENTQEVEMVDAARQLGLPVVCIPHDLETLSTDRCHHAKPLSDLAPFWAEFGALGRADGVFTISTEEQWLLRAFGIDAEYLPYYPGAAIRAELDKVRLDRLSAPRDHILMIGTAMHPPTRRGMAEVLGHLTDRPDPNRPPVVVAGYGTEALAPLIPPGAGVRLLGAVPDAELHRLTVAARAVVVHQRFGCGAMTRICEHLLAGVPVVANTIAARSYHGVPGVYEYASADELFAFLEADLPDPPPPPRPAAAERRFVARVRELAAA